MTKLNTLGVYLGQELYVTINFFDSDYTPNVHKERVLTITDTGFYTANIGESEEYTKLYSLVTGASYVGNQLFKAYTSEQDYLDAISYKHSV